MSTLLSQKILLIVFAFSFFCYLLTYSKQQKGKKPVLAYGTTSLCTGSVMTGHSSSASSNKKYVRISCTGDFEFSPQLLFIYE